ncbi:hypothetical protein LCGC14_0823480 [marine sediment metagenome]|uniref:Cyclic-phosphate processing Receiver domain-containing protein n=1 Tax=marine sediment metagenome TaxID=412755 RepID=A0A0F9PI19_9ZZZZ
MKVYLDDIRTPSYHEEGVEWRHWIVVRTVDNFARLVRTGLVTEVSVDYVLEHSDPNYTGVDALRELLRYCVDHPGYAPHIRIHSAHDEGIKLMQEMCDKIAQLYNLVE